MMAKRVLQLRWNNFTLDFVLGRLQNPITMYTRVLQHPDIEFKADFSGEQVAEPDSKVIHIHLRLFTSNDDGKTGSAVKIKQFHT